MKMLIGIDPDVHKSGVAFLDNGKVNLYNLTFFELFEMLSFYKEKTDKPVVYVECGFLNKSNWHRIEGKNSAFNAKIGERTGANFEVAKKICEMCTFLNLEHVKIKPSLGKVNSELFKKITGIKIRTNQEQRDACMLIHGR